MEVSFHKWRKSCKLAKLFKAKFKLKLVKKLYKTMIEQ